jgi:hypothetical protein
VCLNFRRELNAVEVREVERKQALQQLPFRGDAAVDERRQLKKKNFLYDLLLVVLNLLSVLRSLSSMTLLMDILSF